LYRMMGMQLGMKNRFEGGKCRGFRQISIGNNNAFFGGGYMLWPLAENTSKIKIRIKDNSLFNRNFFIDACGYVEIGNGCMVGPDVYIADSNHQYQVGISARDLPMNIGKVIIGDNCWIGAKAVILKDVELGDHCIVGAGAVVTKSFPPKSVIGGVPAVLIKTLE
jgi:acetyltransferase-like isoleucine patch superfamily enzyme